MRLGSTGPKAVLGEEGAQGTNSFHAQDRIPRPLETAKAPKGAEVERDATTFAGLTLGPENDSQGRSTACRLSCPSVPAQDRG